MLPAVSLPRRFLDQLTATVTIDPHTDGESTRVQSMRLLQQPTTDMPTSYRFDFFFFVFFLPKMLFQLSV